ncbi:hypothetical protein EKE94_09290 [Mesobaculum littorinae]|uniref:Uncharacterized protein n=1 Tax=Mesobaculum littorinae TaxID=2486419 RepID=A0A438AG52_9RHOB|nr:hypothetical protein [Mesobaculum littorinae]RVV97690.1 hypothetical protein EKE94_09290 [Mesobaculum littorinae]
MPRTLGARLAEGPTGPGAVFLQAGVGFGTPAGLGETITGRVEIVGLGADRSVCGLRVSDGEAPGAACGMGPKTRWTMTLEGFLR